MDLLILNLCLFCTGTIGVSRIADVANSLRIFKDAADKGYKIKPGGKVILNPNEDVQLKKMARWVPIVNLLDTYNNIIAYNNNVDLILKALEEMDLLEEMSDDEKEIYNKKPTTLNAILTPLKAARLEQHIEVDEEMLEELLKEIPDTEENKEVREILNDIIEQRNKENLDKNHNQDKKELPKRLFKKRK